MTEKTRRKPGRPKLPDGDQRKVRVEVQISHNDLARIDAIRTRTIPPMYLREWCYGAVMMVVAMAEGKDLAPQQEDPGLEKVGLDA